MNEKKKEYNMGALSFIPFLLLVAIPLINMIYNVIAGLPQSENYLSTLAITTVPAIIALFYGKGTVKEKTEAFCGAIANNSIIMMILIFILAGAFSYVTKEMGAVDSVVNLCLSVLPANLIYAGIFVISSIISFSTGTSVGTITAMAAIAYGLISEVGLNVNIGLSAVVGGAVFGDNLSMISDTTIASVRGLGCEMKDKFKMNFPIILPAFVVTVIIYVILGSGAEHVVVNSGEFNVLKVLPYLFIIVLSLCGTDVVVVMSSGILLSGMIGLITKDYTLTSLLTTVGSGVSSMASVTFAVVLVTGMMGVIRMHGGLEWLLEKATRGVHSQKSAEYVMGFLAMALSMLLAGTSAIVVACPLVKPLGEKYGVEPRRSASIIDLFTTMTSALVFWAGCTVIATNLAGAGDPVSLVKFAFYPFSALVCAVMSIQFRLFPGRKAAREREETD